MKQLCQSMSYSIKLISLITVNQQEVEAPFGVILFCLCMEYAYTWCIFNRFRTY